MNKNKGNFQPTIVQAERTWTEEDVDQAVAEIKLREPGLWEQLKEIERATADFNGTEPGYRSQGIVWGMHPDANAMDKINLWSKVRDRWRQECNE